MRHFFVIEHFNRMPHDNSQLGRVPSECPLDNHHAETNIDQLLTIDIVMRHPSSLEVETTTAIAVTTAPPVQNGTLPNGPTTRQLARRRGRQRQRDRQIAMIHQQHQRQRRNQRPETQLPMDYASGQSILSRLEANSWNPLCDAEPTQEQLDSLTDDALLDGYDMERIDPRHTWEQEQLSEFEGFVVLEHPRLLRDEIEQQQNIDAQERLERTRQQERSEPQLLHFEQCDDIDQLLLQMNQPMSYD
jgi:hypothetical protein